MNNRIQYILPKNPKKIILEALSVAKHVCVDELDCSKSCARQKTDKSVDDIVKLMDDKSIDKHFNFIYRDQSFMPDMPDYWDVGFSTMCHRPEYFLWIVLDRETGLTLAKKHKLKEWKI